MTFPKKGCWTQRLPRNIPHDSVLQEWQHRQGHWWRSFNRYSLVVTPFFLALFLPFCFFVVTISQIWDHMQLVSAWFWFILLGFWGPISQGQLSSGNVGGAAVVLIPPNPDYSHRLASVPAAPCGWTVYTVCICKDKHDHTCLNDVKLHKHNLHIHYIKLICCHMLYYTVCYPSRHRGR